MNENLFWKLIDDSNRNCSNDQSCQAKLLYSSLVDMSEQDIYNFEEILRKKIIEADDYKVMAASYIINGYVSDDLYIYFRCWLIGKGKQIFESTLRDPDSLTKYIKEGTICDFEELLYVATKAYSKKVGKEEDETFPRDTCIENGLDYDFGAPPTKGEEWEEDDLPNMFPKLWNTFN